MSSLKEFSSEIVECLRRGATMATARVSYAEKSRCEAILDRGAIDVRVRVTAYRQAGWTSYDPDAAPVPTGTTPQLQCRRVRSGQSLKDFDSEK